MTSPRERAARALAAMAFRCSVPEFVQKDVDARWASFLPHVDAVLYEIRPRGIGLELVQAWIDAIKGGEG